MINSVAWVFDDGISLVGTDISNLQIEDPSNPGVWLSPLLGYLQGTNAVGAVYAVQPMSGWNWQIPADVSAVEQGTVFPQAGTVA